MDLASFAGRFEGVDWLSDVKFKAQCPCASHLEGDPELSLLARQDGGEILVGCFGGVGDTTDAILSAVGLTAADLKIHLNGNGVPARNVEDRWTRWKLVISYLVTHDFQEAIKSSAGRATILNTPPEQLDESAVTNVLAVIDSGNSLGQPPEPLSRTELEEMIRPIATGTIEGELERYRQNLPAVTEQRQVSVYEDIQPALTTLRVYEADEFFDETADLDNVEWLWQGIEPSVGIVGIFGDPESGKSTFERTHSLCMSEGIPCLERNCTQCKVLYLDLANERLSHRRAFTKLGWKRGNLKIVSHDSLIGLPNGLELVDNAIRDIGARMVVVDMMADLLRFKDLNDYADAKRALRGLRLLSQQTSTLINVLHHTPKALGPDADVLKAGLGSQAIVGAFDLRIAIRRRAKNLSTLVMSNGKLGGEPLTEEIVLKRDPETDWITLGGTWAKHRSIYYVDQVVEFLKENAGERMGALRIAEELSLNAPWIRGSLALASKQEKIQRTRIGRAYVYWHGEPDPTEKPPEEKKPEQLNLRRTTPRGDDPDDLDSNGISWSR